MNKEYLRNKMKECLDRGSAFLSEADFHLSLALCLSNDFDLYLEYPVSENHKLNGRTICLDIVAISKNADKKIYGIELKYKTIKTEIDKSILRNEGKHILKNHSARDLGCYGYLYDIQRLKYLKDKNMIDNGFAIILTNDSGYWKNDGEGCSYKDFNLKENRKNIPRIMSWHPELMCEYKKFDKEQAMREFRKKNEDHLHLEPIENIDKILQCAWQSEPKLDGFRFLMNSIEQSADSVSVS